MSKLRVIAYANGELMDLDGRVQSVVTRGDIETCFRDCSVVLNNATTLQKRDLDFKLGSELRVLWEGDTVFRGVVFKSSIDTDGQQTISAYDYNVYLVKNSDTVVIKNKKASDITRELCGKYGVETATIADTGYVLKKFTARGETIFDIITIALTETTKATGNKYRLINDDGKLSLVDVKQATQTIVLENGKNLMSASYSESIEDVKTAVKLTGGDEDKPIVATASSGLASEYGMMQHYEHMTDVKKASELNSLAQSLLADLSVPTREFNVDAIGDINVKSGVALGVNDAMTGISGSFYVSADSHTFTASDVHTMALTLSRTLDIPQKEATAE